MFIYLCLLLILVPALELMLLFSLGSLLGFIPTLALILFTGITGAALARHEGLQALQRIRTALNQGQLPTTDIVDGFLIFASGLLLLTPGFMTDAVGFLLLMPPARAVIRKVTLQALQKHLKIKPVGFGGAARPARPTPTDDVIDVTADSVSDVDGDHSLK
jgi:UPF0716 protein FxsA